MKTPKVAVTGSTGFIGRNLCLHLQQAGWSVRSVLRPQTAVSPPAETEAKIARFELCDLRQAFEGCDLVIHLAGRTRAPSLSLYLEANAAATDQVAQAARETGSRLIFVSSQAAAGPGTRDDPRVEEDPPAPISDYGRSKLAGEIAIEQVDGLDHSILRPCAIYGPGDRDFSLLFSLARRGVLLHLGRPDSAFSLLYIDDLVQAIGAVADHRPSSPSNVFFVAGERAHSVAEFMRTLASVCGVPYRPIRVPSLLLWLTSLAATPAARMGLNPLLTRSRYRELTAPGFVCSAEKLRRSTGFRARISLDEGVRRTHAWYARRHPTHEAT